MIVFLKMLSCLVACSFIGVCVAQDSKGNPHFQVDHKSGKLDIMATRSSADIQSTEDYVDLVMKPGEDTATENENSASQRHDTPDQSRGGSNPIKSGWRNKMRSKGSDSGALSSADTRNTESDKNIVNFNPKWDNLFKFPKVNSTVDTNVRKNVTSKNETTKGWKGEDTDKMVELEKGAYDLAKMIQDGSPKNDPTKIKDAARQLEEKVANLQKNVLQNLAAVKDKTLSKLKSESKTEKAAKLDEKVKDKKLCSNCGTKVPKPGEKDEDGKLIVPKLSGANESLTTSGFKEEKSASSGGEIDKEKVKMKEDGKVGSKGGKVCPTCGTKVPKPGDKDEVGTLIVPKITETNDTSSKNGFKGDANAKEAGGTMKPTENLIVPKLSGTNETSAKVSFKDGENSQAGEETVKATENKKLKGGKICPTCGTKVPKPGDKDEDGNLIVPKLSGTDENVTENSFKEDENATKNNKNLKATKVCPNCGAKVPKPGDKDEDGNLIVPKLSGTNETSSNSGTKGEKESKAGTEVKEQQASFEGTKDQKAQEFKNSQGKTATPTDEGSKLVASKLSQENETKEILDQSALKENKTVMVIDKGKPDRSESFDLDDDSQEITEEAEETDVLNLNKQNEAKNETVDSSNENKQEFRPVTSSDTKVVNETKPEASKNFNEGGSKIKNLQRKKPKETKSEEDKADRNQDENEGKGKKMASTEGEGFGALEGKESALAKGEGEKSENEGKETKLSSSEGLASTLGQEDKSGKERLSPANRETNKATSDQRLDSSKWTQNGNVAENSGQGEKEKEEKTSNHIIDPNKVGEKTEPEDAKEKDEKGDDGDGKEKGNTFAEREENRYAESQGKLLEKKEESKNSESQGKLSENRTESKDSGSQAKFSENTEENKNSDTQENFSENEGESKNSESEQKLSGNNGESKDSGSQAKLSENMEENKNSDTQEKLSENPHAMKAKEAGEGQQENATLSNESQAKDSSQLNAEETVKTVKQFDSILNNFLKNTTKEKGKELLKLTWHDLRQKYTQDFGGNKNTNNPGQKEDLSVLKDANKNGPKNEALGTTEKEKSDSVNQKESKKGDDLKAIVNRLKYKISLLKDLAYQKHKKALEKPKKEKAMERDFDPYQGFKRG